MNKVITISREFGSGGREVGFRLAQKLGIPFYDKEIRTAILRKRRSGPMTRSSAEKNGLTMIMCQ